MLATPLERPGAVLRKLIEGDIVLLPGVFSAISAKSASSAGAKALYLSGAGVTNSLLAVPDIALLTMSEMAQQARYVCSASGLPVIADADTGYGEALSVFRTVREFEAAGLAGLHIEDQLSPKRCGHLDGKSLVPVEAMQAKLRAAADARRDKSFVLIARTDARAVEGLDAAADRARAYVDAGADAIFPEGLESESEFAEFRRAVQVPLLANMTEFGKTPLITVDRFSELGYHLVIFPMTAFRVALKALDEAYSCLLREGTQQELLGSMRTRAELYELLAYADYDALDRGWSSG